MREMARIAALGREGAAAVFFVTAQLVSWAGTGGAKGAARRFAGRLASAPQARFFENGRGIAKPSRHVRVANWSLAT